MPVLKQLLARFRHDRRGNVALIFAITLIPVIGFIGIAVDFSRAALTRSRMQSALDQTALRLVRDFGQASQTELEQKAAQFFKASFDATDTVATGALTVTRNGKDISVATDANLTPAFMQVLGQNAFVVAAKSGGTFDDTKIELVLVLDNTGSMAANNKMVELRKAATNLINQVQALNPQNDQFRISIVPFDTHVRIDPTYRSNTNFIKFPSVASDYKYDTLTTQAGWTGCVSDRDDTDSKGVKVNMDVKGTAATSLNATTLYPGVKCPGGQQIGLTMPLSTDWNALKAVVASMQPAGNTNITLGFHWGLQMLSDSATPLSLGAAANAANVKKFIVFLTDGDNTVNRWSNTAGPINTKTLAMCNEIKNTSAIQIFTVGVLTNDSANLLHDCASVPGNYYKVQNSTEIGDVFAAIFKQISKLRLSS